MHLLLAKLQHQSNEENYYCCAIAKLLQMYVTHAMLRVMKCVKDVDIRW